MIPSLNYAEIEVLIAIHQVKAEVQLGEIWRDKTILSSLQWNSDEFMASSWFWSTLGDSNQGMKKTWLNFLSIQI